MKLASNKSVLFIGNKSSNIEFINKTLESNCENKDVKLHIANSVIEVASSTEKHKYSAIFYETNLSSNQSTDNFCFFYIIKYFKCIPIFILDTDINGNLLDIYNITKVNNSDIKDTKAQFIEHFFKDIAQEKSITPVKTEKSDPVSDVAIDKSRYWPINSFDEYISDYYTGKNKLSFTHELINKLDKHDQTLKHLAFIDSLTGLYNRLFFNRIFKHSLADAKSNNKSIAVLFIDLDNFKTINDMHGHYIGDKVLQETATRIQSNLRKNDITARFGGDEFIVSISTPSDLESVRYIANKLLLNIRIPMNINELSLSITASIGISLFPDNGESLCDLVRLADEAMYKVKFQGKNAIAVCS